MQLSSLSTRCQENIKNFSDNVIKKNLLKSCSKEQLEKISKYIEEKFIPNLKKSEYSYKENKKLAGNLEYAPKTKQVFIHFPQEKLGEGWAKKGTYSILYDTKHPVGCIRLVLKNNQVKKHPHIVKQYNKEIDNSEALQKKTSHIAKTIASIAFKEKGKKRKAMIQKLYEHGTLSSLIAKKPELLTPERKFKIAGGIMKGLKEMHKKGYVHRDLHAGNIFVDKNFKSYIGDFGWSTLTTKMKNPQAQSHPGLTAPELFCPANAKPKDYKRGELFSAGLIMYQLCHEKKPDWTLTKDKNLFKKLVKQPSKDKVKKDIDDFCNKINDKVRNVRFTIRDKLEKKGQESLTRREMLKHAALELTHPDPEKRKTTDYWIKFFKKAKEIGR